MIEFLIGLFVLALLGVIAVFGVLLFPVFIVLGFFLRIVIGVILLLFLIWLVGKATLMMIEYFRNRKS